VHRHEKVHRTRRFTQTAGSCGILENPWQSEMYCHYPVALVLPAAGELCISPQMMKMNKQNLISNLKKASDYFKSLGEVTDLYYDETAHDFGQTVENLKTKIENDTITDDELKKLWLIFAPTCTWDDFQGSVDLGNEIFETLKVSFHDRIDRTMNNGKG
jgi:hypothetical protein